MMDKFLFLFIFLLIFFILVLLKLGGRLYNSLPPNTFYCVRMASHQRKTSVRCHIPVPAVQAPAAFVRFAVAGLALFAGRNIPESELAYCCYRGVHL